MMTELQVLQEISASLHHIEIILGFLLVGIGAWIFTK
jgi:hypothetical protein